MSECNHNCTSCGEGAVNNISGLTDSEFDVLFALERYQYLPIARFVLSSSREEEAYAVALEPVYIVDETDSMETVRKSGELFDSLLDKGLISVDYDQPLGAYPYDEYKNSELYAFFVQTVEEGKSQENFLFDTPVLEMGSIALTCVGRKLLAKVKGE